MTRLLVALLVALGVATVWRRKELRNDTERASKAVVNAASVARTRLGAAEPEGSPSVVDAEEADADAVESVEALTGD